MALLFRMRAHPDGMVSVVDSSRQVATNATERIIMRLRYIEGYKWEKVCVETNYSWEGIHKIHRKILKKIS